MTALLPDPTLAAQLSELAAHVDALRVAAETSIDLGTRLDTLEHELAGAVTRLDTLAALGALPDPQRSPGSGGPYQHASLAEWVDVVFTRLAARHQARWCPRWDQHLEAVGRLSALWHTWEASHAEPVNWPARDEWTRVVFDHHTTWLLDREGPFAGCTPQRCAAAPRLAQTPLHRDRPALVAQLDAYRHAAAAVIGASR
jgi:Domain of unknown function (DUF4913)